MSDADKELRQWIKEEFDRSLAGWTFTPEMHRTVLERIAREEGPEATPVSAPPRRFRPAYWVAAAAAAFVLAVNLWPRVFMNQPQSGSAPDAALMAAQESAPGAAGAAPGEADRGDGLRIRAVPAESGAGSPVQADLSVTSKSEPPRALEPRALTLAPVRLTLSVAELPAPVSEERGAVFTVRAQDTSGSESAEAAAEEDGAALTMGAVPDVLDLHPLPNGNVAVIKRLSVQVVDEFGNLVSESPVEPEAVAVAVGPAGESAVVAADALIRLTAEGKPAGSVRLDAFPALVAVGGDRAAVADAHGVEVYDGGARVWTLPGLQPQALALAPDGALALLTGSPPDARLRIYAADGALQLDRPVAPEGAGFGFLGDGQLLAVGSAVYDRSGSERWRFPFAPARVSALAGGGSVLAWNSRQAARVLTDGGIPVWVAELTEGSIVRASGSAAGELVVVVAAADQGAAVWAIDPSGNQRHAERLSEIPVDATASGEHLLLLTPAGLQVRTLNR